MVEKVALLTAPANTWSDTKRIFKYSVSILFYLPLCIHPVFSSSRLYRILRIKFLKNHSLLLPSTNTLCFLHLYFVLQSLDIVFQGGDDVLQTSSVQHLHNKIHTTTDSQTMVETLLLVLIHFHAYSYYQALFPNPNSSFPWVRLAPMILTLFPLRFTRTLTVGPSDTLIRSAVRVCLFVSVSALKLFSSCT